jgi:16S rRNA (adenine1518-N6/adenine1519-N6)-dimethyltransferase
MNPKKSLGQHFLTSRAALQAIVDAAHLEVDDIVLEIGPGKGALTAALLKRAARVVAVEKDDRLISYLSDRFSAEIKTGKLELIHADILGFDPQICNLKSEIYNLIANIPYYITGALLEKFLAGPCQPKKAVLLMQKEVAERVVGKGGKQSLLSISVCAFGKPRYIRTVKASAFSPQPKVDSAIIAIEHISREFFEHINETHFFNLVRTGFAHKRKRLASNLKEMVSPSVFEELGIEPNARAEELSIEQWKKLVEHKPIHRLA